MKTTGNTHPGMIRESNQDGFAYGRLGENDCWAVVCDGMGGAKAGNVASRLAIKYISKSFVAGYRNDMSENTVKNLMQAAIYTANEVIFEKAAEEEFEGMGTTAVAVMVLNGVVHIAHCGDSRAYLISQDAISQITKDHSIVQIMLDTGQITKEQAKTHPKKHIITRAVGAENKINVEYTREEISENEMILLCSDGLTNFVDDEEIFNIVKNDDFDTVTQRLINTANQNGGGDNITVVVIANDNKE